MVPLATLFSWNPWISQLWKLSGECNGYFWRDWWRAVSGLQQKNFFILGVMCIKGFQLKRGKNLLSVMSVMPVTPRHSALLTQEEQIRGSRQRANRSRGRGNVSFNKNSLKKKTKHPCFLSTITAPPPQFYFNIMFHILFCFQVTFQEKGHFFFSTISHNSLIKHSIYHKPLPTRSQVSSYWLWFIDEWNSQLCRWGLDIHNLVPWVKIQSQRAPSCFISLGSWLKSTQ